MKQMFARLLVAFTLVLPQAVLADKAASPWAFNAPRAEGYTIDAIALAPLAGTVLVRGETVTFTVTLAYELDVAPKGDIVLVFQDEKNRRLTGDRPQVRQSVERGKGQVTLTDTIVVPSNCREIWLYIPLVPDGMKRTKGEVTLGWPVVKSPK